MTGEETGQIGLAQAKDLGDMPHYEMSWQVATIVAVCFGCAAAIARLIRHRAARAAAPFLRESGLVVGLFALWQYAGSFSVMGTEGALGRAEWIWRTERAWHLPREDAVQRLVLPHPFVVEALNIYYATMHFTVLIIFLIWLFARHRQYYRQVRPVLVCLTAACLLIQLVPVAPPRMLAGAGFVDTAALYGQSVYSIDTMADQFSAMPSVHIAWAMLIALGVWQATSSWRGRSLALAHAAVTWIVVVATANHFWLDGIVAAALLIMAVAATAACRALAGRVVAMRRAAEPGLATVTDGVARLVGDHAPAETLADKLGVSADVRSTGVR